LSPRATPFSPSRGSYTGLRTIVRGGPVRQYQSGSKRCSWCTRAPLRPKAPAFAP
jgi:hypothetical protein